MAETRAPRVLRPGKPPAFPDPRSFDARGLVAAGGELSPAWLLAAYERGIFPWYDEGLPPLWWCPDPRCVMDASSLHVSRSMQRFIRGTAFSLRYDCAFREVMLACAEDREDGTWILPEMVTAYCELHRLGHAHSVEVWDENELVGGLYGVQRGALFAAESMFHRRTNASKLALIAAIRSLFRAGVRVFDVQFPTPHLSSLGAYAIARGEYLDRVAAACASELDLSVVQLSAT